MGVGDDELDAPQAAPSQLTQKLGPESLGLRRADVHAQHFPPSVRIDPDRHDHGHRDDAMVVAHLHVGGVEPDIGPIAFQRAIEKGLHPFVDLLAQPADLALGDAGCAHGPHQIIDRSGRDALDIGLLDHGGQRFLGHPPRLEETWKVRALAQLGDAKLHRPGSRLPVPVAIAVALGEPVGRAFAEACASSGADLHLHQPLGGESDHLAQDIRVGGLLHQRAKVHHLVGHRGFLGLRLQFATRTYRKTADGRRKPLARYSAMKSALRERLAPPQLHHAMGHDPKTYDPPRSQGGL